MKVLSLFAVSVFAAGLALSSAAIAAEDSSYQGSSGMSSQEMGSQDAGSQRMGATEAQSQAQQGSMASSDPQVRQIQQALKQQGYNTGPVDGKMGPKTAGALRNFQRDQGIQTSGQIDQQTLQALGVTGTGEAQEQFGVSPEFGTEQQEQREQETDQLDQTQQPEQMEESETQQPESGTMTPQGGMSR